MVTDAQASLAAPSTMRSRRGTCCPRCSPQENGIVPGLLDKLSITAAPCTRRRPRARALPKVSAASTHRRSTSRSPSTSVHQGRGRGEVLKDEFVSVEHLFLGLLEVAKPDALKKLLRASASSARRC